MVWGWPTYHGPLLYLNYRNDLSLTLEFKPVREIAILGGRLKVSRSCFYQRIIGNRFTRINNHVAILKDARYLLQYIEEQILIDMRLAIDNMRHKYYSDPIPVLPPLCSLNEWRRAKVK
jgi:hypothetical protein